MSVDGEPGLLAPLAPDGSRLAAARRLSTKQARSWLKREDVVLGRWPCGAIAWASAGERPALAAALRARTGRDCHPGGDFLLYRLPDRRRGLVLDEPE